MRRVIVDSPKDICGIMIDTLIENGKIQKAGIWQGTEVFKDLDLKVQTNRELDFDVPETEEELVEICHPDLPWSEVHFQERVSGKPLNPGESYKIWPYNVFKKDNDPFLKDKRFDHTYMERFWPKFAGYNNHSFDRVKQPELYKENVGIYFTYGDLDDVIKQLSDNPLTRQAYLPIFFPEDTGAKNNIRVPCTIGYYFWIEDNRVYCNYIIRSCDAFRHFRNDVYLTARLVQYVSQKLNYVPGRLTMFIFNFHVFINDLYLLNKKENKIWTGKGQVG